MLKMEGEKYILASIIKYTMYRQHITSRDRDLAVSLARSENRKRYVILIG